MEIIFKSYHDIDIINNRTSRRNIDDRFNEIIQSMIQKIDTNTSVRAYKPEGDSTQVVMTVKMVTDIYKRTDIEDKEARYMLKADEVADRLRIKEIRVEENMGHLNGVQKGSLIQALIKNNDSDFRYLIAKVEHSKFIDEDDLILKSGFNPDENKIWKTCIFNCIYDDEEVEIDEASVYVNNKATYWVNEFLELQELRSNEKNTKDAWKSIESNLKKHLKKGAPSDYFVLRNAVINYFRNSQEIIYDDMLDIIFTNYEPIDTQKLKIEEIKTELKKLPDEKNFDRKFTSAPTEIKAKIKSIHKVNNDIDIIIKAGLEGELSRYKDVIHTEDRKDGNRFLVIKVTDDETYNMLNLDRVDN